jgi:hypothetical protein
MLALFSPLPGTLHAIGGDERYDDPGIFALAFSVAGGVRKAWGRAVSGFWSGHRKAAANGGRAA